LERIAKNLRKKGNSKPGQLGRKKCALKRKAFGVEEGREKRPEVLGGKLPPEGGMTDLTALRGSKLGRDPCGEKGCKKNKSR